jgi:large subunit ribosomal protein L3
MATKALVGEKVGMTQVWDDDNNVVPVTVLRVQPVRVVQVKTDEHDGYSALQVTFGSRDARKLTKPVAGHYDKAGVDPGVKLVELRLDDVSECSPPISSKPASASTSRPCRRARASLES